MLLLALAACVTDPMVLPLYDQDHDGFYDALGADEGATAPYDCDDADASVHPDAPETCDGRDEDCDGIRDDDPVDVTTWHLDADADGYGSAGDSQQACDAPDHYVADGTDCDDLDPNVHPGLEADGCNGVDDDCDGATDEDRPSWHYDGDGDGYGSDVDVVSQCAPPTGYIAQGGDCDDANKRVNPEATEYCNGRDDDCDGLLDNDDPSSAGDATWYADADGDGFGDASTSVTACGQPAGYADNPEDCDDASDLAFPGGAEVCEDGLDGDCDGAELPCGLGGTRAMTDASATFVTGSATLDGLGIAVAFGDFDADGHQDALMTALADGVYVVPGDSSLFLGTQTLRTTYDDLWNTNEAYRTFAVGDFDGDGASDALLGVMDTSGPGSARLVYGGALPSGDTSTLPLLEGVSNGDRAAWTLGSGDIDGDGDDEMIVGAWQVDEAYVLLGSPSRRAGTTSLADADIVFEGDGGVMSAAIASGDFDGDGIADLVLGTGTDDCDSCSSPSWLYLGRPTWPSALSIDDADVRIGLGESVHHLGSALALGDTEGDGYADLLDAATYITTGDGTAWLFDGGAAPGSSLLTSAAVSTFSGFETAGANDVAGVGLHDVDGDGGADVVLTAPGDDAVASDAGAVFVFLGAPSGSHTTASADVTLLGDATGAHGGIALAWGDLNGDGAADVLMGQDASFTAPGAVGLFYGAP